MAKYNTNVIILTGNLGKDPEFKYTQNGKAVATFPLAVGDGDDEALWVTIETWEKTAEFVGQYLKKGNSVLVNGRLKKAEAWIGKDGKPYAKLVVNGKQIELLKGEPKSDNKPAEDATDMLATGEFEF